MKRGNVEEFMAYINIYLKEHQLSPNEMLQVIGSFTSTLVGSAPHPELKNKLIEIIEYCFKRERN